jgi:hypothetical protein
MPLRKAPTVRSATPKPQPMHPFVRKYDLFTGRRAREEVVRDGGFSRM